MDVSKKPNGHGHQGRRFNYEIPGSLLLWGRWFFCRVEEETGTHYVSIPASNQLVDYEEYYRIDKRVFEKHRNDLKSLIYVADEARNYLRDNDLLIQHGPRRGVSC